MKLLPHPRVLSQADVFRLLGRQVAEDAIRANWIAPRAVKPNGKASKLFALEDVARVEDRILNGEYPRKEGK
jgi:hypothetical protein